VPGGDPAPVHSSAAEQSIAEGEGNAPAPKLKPRVVVKPRVVKVKPRVVRRQPFQGSQELPFNSAPANKTIFCTIL
jgi:hypothetical protein